MSLKLPLVKLRPRFARETGPFQTGATAQRRALLHGIAEHLDARVNISIFYPVRSWIAPVPLCRSLAVASRSSPVPRKAAPAAVAGTAA